MITIIIWTFGAFLCVKQTTYMENDHQRVHDSCVLSNYGYMYCVTEKYQNLSRNHSLRVIKYFYPKYVPDTDSH